MFACGDMSHVLLKSYYVLLSNLVMFLIWLVMNYIMFSNELMFYHVYLDILCIL